MRSARGAPDGDAARRALLLSGSIGLGHEMLVRSCSGVLRAAGWQVDSLDCMGLLGRRCGPAGQRLFTEVVTAAPGLYDGLHFAHLRAGSRLASQIDRRACARLVPAIRREVEARPADLILSVFATGASAAAKLKAEAPQRPTVVLCTDVTLHRLWVHDGTDLFIATSPAAVASVRRYLPRAAVAQIPPPVRPTFYAAPGRVEARSALGIPQSAAVVLVMDSGWGLGRLSESVAALASSGVEVLAVAGRRRALAHRYAEIARRSPRVHPFGFVDDVPWLMSAADAVVTLPGATSCAEARVVARPLVLLDLMPGHGRENLLHELELGAARASGPAPADVAAATLAVIEDPPPPVPAPPHWEPAFCSALARVGIDLSPALSAASMQPPSGAEPLAARRPEAHSVRPPPAPDRAAPAPASPTR